MVVFLLFLALLLALAFFNASLVAGAIAVTAFTVVSIPLADTGALMTTLLVVTSIVFILLAYPQLRRTWISRPAYGWFKKVAPRLSDTEREALDAGTVWWDAELFSGKPDWQRLLSAPIPKLRADEQAFLDGPVEELCAMLDDWEILQHEDMPERVWTFLRQNKFFSMIIEKKYGGLGFSACGNSAVVTRIASKNLTAAVTVMVPNSLGPGELLRDFGTTEQQDYYLPRLASGEDIPCFALTGPTAGSDAGAMPDSGVICKGQWQGEEILGLRLNWNKRYITLSPVATLLGLAFKAYDPDHLLGDTEELGITCALIPVDTPGVETGNRHYPVGAVFMNGPTHGKDVFIPLDYIIGGRERIGQGWRMLMHSLAAGRAISLPALGTAGTKYTAKYTGEYARVRRQFGIPIAYLEGIEEPLARMAGEAYRVNAARLLTLSGLELGEKPGVLSAILKYHATEANRRCVIDAMDIHAGKGIITGPGNYLAALYQTLPIAITVEGANILTRSMIIFGQGAIRNHPYLQKEIALAGEEIDDDSVARFDETLFSHVGFVLRNFARTFLFGITGARLIPSPVSGRTAHYYRQLTRLSSAFAFVSDVVLLTLGGSFKFKEKISGRLADVFIHLYLASAVLKYHRDCGSPAEDHPLVHWAIRDSLFQVQNALVNALRNFPYPVVGPLVKWFVFPLGRPYKEPSDRLGKYVARILFTAGPARDRLCEDLYVPKGAEPLSVLDRAFAGVLAAAPVEKRLKTQLGRDLSLDNVEEVLSEAVEKAVISAEEGEQLRETYRLVREVIAVDDFAPGSRTPPAG